MSETDPGCPLPHIDRLLGLTFINSLPATLYFVAAPLATLVVERMPIHLDPEKPGSAVLFEIDLQSTDHISWIAGRNF